MSKPTLTKGGCSFLAQTFCGQVSKGSDSFMWQWSAGNCSIFDHIWGAQPNDITSVGLIGPPPPPPLKPDDLYDLYDYSCLNGWTMGNIAVAPVDVVRFYHALFTYKLAGKEKVAEMLRWHNVTTGWGGAGLKYGMGLMRFPTGMKDVHGMTTNVTYVVGHPGADWGSNMMTVGWFPHLNLSLALATNSGDGGLNFTEGVGRGSQGGFGAVSCQVQAAAVRFALPDHAPLACPSYAAQAVAVV